MGNCCRGILAPRFANKEGAKLAHLPRELITEVLIRLPVKSLLRFRCVSKSLCAIIDSKHFVYSHLNRSDRDRSHLNLVFPTNKEISTNYDSAKLHHSDIDVNRWHYFLKVHGYCNGVFLLLIDQCIPSLWNPSTHHLRILPRFPGCMFLANYGRYINAGTGLGYDSSRDEYKVVIVQTVIHDFYCKPHTVDNIVWIFGSRSNSWRKVYTDFFRAGASGYYHFGRFVNGHLHWLFRNIDDYFSLESQCIVAFDLANETFSTTSQPTYYTAKGTTSFLNVLDGCLSIGFHNFSIKNEAVLYVQKKDGAEFTWSLVYSVTRDQLLPLLQPHDKFFPVEVLGYSEAKDKIMLDLGLDYMVSYDLKERCFQPTETIKPTNNGKTYTIKSFAESLVPVRDKDLEQKKKKISRDYSIAYFFNMCLHK